METSLWCQLVNAMAGTRGEEKSDSSPLDGNRSTICYRPLVESDLDNTADDSRCGRDCRLITNGGIGPLGQDGYGVG